MICNCYPLIKELKRHLEEEYKDVCRLLILYKITYYKPELLCKRAQILFTVVDQQYDSMEERYLQLCQYLELPNILSHQPYEKYSNSGTGMMEVDITIPIVEQTIKEANEKYGK